MNCIFCNKNSDSSKTIEHIIPESLGNSESILPKGIVCDKCNNYFAVEVEKPFIELESIKQTRFRQGILNKRRKGTQLSAILNALYPTTLFEDSIVASDDVVNELINKEKGTIILLKPSIYEEKEIIISRFLAKVAIEVLAELLINAGFDYYQVIDQASLKDIRNHARGIKIIDWPIHIRQLYHENLTKQTDDNNYEQTVFSYNFLQTEIDEYYFVFVYFGVEYAINIGEANIDGYINLLKEENKKNI